MRHPPVPALTTEFGKERVCSTRLWGKNAADGLAVLTLAVEK